MNKMTAILVCIIALLAGSVFYLWVNRTPVNPGLQIHQTDQVITEIKDTVETVTARIQEQDSQTRTEVRVIRETVRTKVNALPADSVCLGLNDELALFRGLDSGTGELDDE